MAAHDTSDFDSRQRALEQNVHVTAAASKIHIDVLVLIERRLFWIQMALIACFLVLVCLYFGRR